MSLRHKDLLSLAQLSREEIELVLDTAEACKQIFDRPVKKFPTLRGKVVVNLFYEASTRTRTSFELAGKWMSADVVNFTASTSSVMKGESLSDTAKTLEALGADIIVIRHRSPGAAHLVARAVRSRVINAGDGAHEHPTQALLDLFTIREKKGRLDGLTVTIVGDILHSRVARSQIIGLSRMGARVRVAGPPTLIPAGLEQRGVEVYHRLEPAIDGADVINVLRIQRERQAKGLFPSIREYVRLYGLTRERLAAAKEDVLVMHPGPANLGVEIAQDVVEDPRSAVREQVTNGVAVRMALLYLMSGGDARELQSAG
ncbi:MAG: aspartate carbamoyltransferase catalytic subunit [Clostridia bacterium]|nr:aspartate carbamoyltransferase [Bacillota bacterium]MBO2520206.1 aspartate carbamoyltransferase [Bacillota bacterium]